MDEEDEDDNEDDECVEADAEAEGTSESKCEAEEEEGEDEEGSSTCTWTGMASVHESVARPHSREYTAAGSLTKYGPPPPTSPSSPDGAAAKPHKEAHALAYAASKAISCVSLITK